MLLLNEWRYCWYQPTVKVILLLTPMLGLMMAGVAEQGQSGQGAMLANLHSSFILLLMLGLPLLLGALSPLVFLRDSNACMAELIACTPVTLHKRMLTRYGILLVLLVGVFGLWYVAVLLAFDVGQQQSAANVLLHGGANFVLLALPSLMFSAAMMLWLCQKWKSSMAVYVAVGCWGMGYLVLASMTGSPLLAGSSVLSEDFYLAMLWLDPYGITPLQDGMSVKGVEFSHYLLVNRLLYVLLSGLLVFAALRIACLRIGAEPFDKKSTKGTVRAGGNAVSREVFGSPLLQLVFNPLLVLVKNRVTVLILLLWTLLIFNEVASGSYLHMPNVASKLNSIDALNLVAFDLLPVLGAFVLALWSWFVCRLDKRQGIEELVGALPISNQLMIVAHILTMAVMTLLLLLLCALAVLAAQLMVGSQILLSHYVVQLGLSGLPLLLLSMVFVAVHHICRSQGVAGVIIITILLVKFTPITTAFGLTHTLWNIAGVPLQQPDNFWGYSGSLSLYLPYMSVWLLVVGSLLLLAVALGHRGTELGALKWANVKGLTKSTWIMAVVALLCGGSLHLALEAEKPLTNSHKKENWQRQYQATYGDWQHKPQPSIVEVYSKVDIYPSEQRAQLDLVYRLKNTTESAIKQVLVGRYGNYDSANIELKQAKLVSFDAELNQGVYELNAPLLSGEYVDLNIAFNYQQPTLWPHRSNQVVKPEFSYLASAPLLPVVGYQQDFLQGPKVKLDKVDTLISTHINHHALSQGKLARQWQQGQRAFYHYQSNLTIHSMPTWLSMPFAPVSKEFNGANLRVKLNVYSPDEDEKFKAVNIHLNAMEDTLNWFAEHIGPYVGNQLSVIATPKGTQTVSLGGIYNAQIMLVEHSANFRLPNFAGRQFDKRYAKRVYHSAGQWFASDNVFWSQVVAKYVELILVEKRYGVGAYEQMVSLAHQQLATLSANSNVPDTRLSTELKSVIAFAKLRQLAPDEMIIATIKQLWAAQTNTSVQDFVEAVDGQLHGLEGDKFAHISELFDKVKK